MSLPIRLTAAIALVLSFSACNTELQSADDVSADASLSKFEALTRSERLATYETLAVDKRTSLWRAHINRLLTEQTLTGPQQDALLTVREALPTLLSGKNQLILGHAAVVKLQEAFGAEEAEALLSLPGRPEATGKNAQALVGQGEKPGSKIDCDRSFCTLGLGRRIFTTGSMDLVIDCNLSCKWHLYGCGWLGQFECDRVESWDTY